MGKFSERVARELTLYVRHVAWLNAVPRPAPGSKRAEIAAKAGEGAPSATRLDRLKAVGVKTPPLPPCPLPHVIGWLFEIGLQDSIGMGAAPLSWREINGWCDATGVDLSGWDRRLIRRLSVDYVGEARRAEDESCPSPWRAPVTAEERASEDARLRMVLG